MQQEHYTWQELEDLPTLNEGYTADLKVEGFGHRWWLERTTTLDGEHCDHHVTHERFDQLTGRWETVGEW